MIFYENVWAVQSRIEKAIKKYGYAPEHNFWWYQTEIEKKSKNVFVEFKNGMGLLTIIEKEKKRASIFSSPIAPPLRRVHIIIEYLNHILLKSKEIQKVTLELESELYKKLKETLPRALKARSINYTLIWPVYKLKMFDEKLSSKRWKTLRKTKNKFYQNHSITISDAKEYKDKELLHNIINEWRKKRGGHDRAYFSQYHNFIDQNFEGASEARVFIVDKRVCGINAGWLIPNSNRFYGALGIHDYSLPGLGDVLYIEDLIWLKKHGYKEVDMGGGEKDLTSFKNKFHPQSFYKTHIFSVVRS